MAVALIVVLADARRFAARSAVQPDEILADPALEARARALSKELRCMVCQNQSIDDSDAPLARDLRVLVRERLKAGDSDGQVLDFLVARYGEFVLLKPRFSLHTALLWLAPAAVLLHRRAGALRARAPLSRRQIRRRGEQRSRRPNRRGCRDPRRREATDRSFREFAAPTGPTPRSRRRQAAATKTIDIIRHFSCVRRPYQSLISAASAR